MRDLVKCQTCGEGYHYSWCAVWNSEEGRYIPIPEKAFHCVKCRVRGKK